MKHIIPVVLLSVCTVTGILIDAQVNGYSKLYPPETPVVNIPIDDRQENWLRGGEGSCTWASIIPLLRWSGHYELADAVKHAYGGGEFMEEWPSKLDRAGIRYAISKGGDTVFLEWAIATRRGAAIGINPASGVARPTHMVILAHLDGFQAILIDPNEPRENKVWSRDKLLSEWKAAGGYAVVPVYVPAAPLP